jgi:hypothetical protein
MAHGMSSGKKMVGSSAAYAAASEFLFRGYNVAFPEFDMGVADDLLVFSPDNEKVSRIQVRSRQFNSFPNGLEGRSTEIYMPVELLGDDNPLDFVIIALRFEHRWLTGIFDQPSLKNLVSAGVGSFTEHVGQKTYDLRATYNQSNGRLYFSKVDVSYAFSSNPPSRWDELFPVRNTAVKPLREKNFEAHHKEMTKRALDLFAS